MEHRGSNCPTVGLKGSLCSPVNLHGARSLAAAQSLRPSSTSMLSPKTECGAQCVAMQTSPSRSHGYFYVCSDSPASLANLLFRGRQTKQCQPPLALQCLRIAAFPQGMGSTHRAARRASPAKSAQLDPAYRGGQRGVTFAQDPSEGQSSACFGQTGTQEGAWDVETQGMH